MGLAEIPSHQHAPHDIGVLGGYFARTQLSSWLPEDLARQTGAGHVHSWVNLSTSYVHEAATWQGMCKGCLCRLQVNTTVEACTPNNGCIDANGHHMHVILGTAFDDQSQSLEAVCLGNARCCKCAFEVCLQLQTPIIEPEMASALEQARYAPYPHHRVQGIRDFVTTVKALRDLAVKASKGETRPISTKNEKAIEKLKFDPPCTYVLDILGFVRTDTEYFPPPAVGDSELRGLSHKRLLRAADELFILAEKAIQRLPVGERSEFFKTSPATDALASALGANSYSRFQSPLSVLALGHSSKLANACSSLGVPQNVDDSYIQWQYSKLAEEDDSDAPLDGPQAQKRFDSLETIASARHSEKLASLVEAERTRGMVTTAEIGEASRAVFNEIVDLDLLSPDIVRDAFNRRLSETSSTEARVTLANHLSVLACAMRDQALREYAIKCQSAAPVKEDTPPIDTWTQLPTGLNNIGNTCYLNCLLQCLYSIVPIRQAVLRYGDGKTWNEAFEPGRRDSGQALTEPELRRALRFVQLLKRLFEDMTTRRLKAWEETFERQNSAGGNHPLASTLTAPVAVSPERELADMLLNVSEDTGRTLNQQQDVDECMAQCVGLLVHALPPPSSDKSAEDDSWIHRLLAGHFETTTTKVPRPEPTENQNGDADKPGTEMFLTLNLNIPDQTTDINKCIASFFAPSTVSTDAMNVDGSTVPTSIVRRTRLLDAPPVLCMQVQRVQFDMTTMRAFKINSHLRLHRRVSLDPFTDFEAISEATQKQQKLQSRLDVVENHLRALQVPVPSSANSRQSGDTHMNIVSALERTHAFTEGVSRWSTLDSARSLLEDLPQTAADISQNAKVISQQLQTMLDTFKNAEAHWTKEKATLLSELNSVYENVPDGDMTYTLHAVFIHSGTSPEFGHYWLYIRDFDWVRGEERWLKFNDAVVSAIPHEEVLSELPKPGQEAANPYYLVFVRSADVEKTANMGI
ncbi:ubiquitin-specific protease ubp2 [Coemansia sp. Benny D115]|nr:ubiquitin-specific protease ubp2 [Coemansia sp. Benny D115]